MKRRGGVRQRALAAANETNPSQSGELPALLLRSWAWGDLSLPQVQRIADAAVADMGAAGGRPSEQLKFLASMGGAGRQSHNMQLGTRGSAFALSSAPRCFRYRAIRRRLPQPSLQPKLIELPSISGGATSLPVLWPHAT